MPILNPFVDYDVSDGDAIGVHTVIGGTDTISFQFISIGFDAADAEVTILQSNDNVNFTELSPTQPPLPIIVNAGNDVNVVNINKVSARYFAAQLTVNSVTSGTLTVNVP